MRKDETSTYVATPGGFGLPAAAATIPARVAIDGSAFTGNTATNTGAGANVSSA